MPVRVLVVDDSGFFRRRVSEMLDSDPRLEVIGSAVDGAEAINQASALRPDVITMDIEMPVMDGITAVRRIMAARPTPILMFSSLTTDGARATLDALDAGAVDYLPKRFEDISRDRDEARRKLCDRVYEIGRNGHVRRSLSAPVLARSSAAVIPPTATTSATSEWRSRSERAPATPATPSERRHLRETPPSIRSTPTTRMPVARITPPLRRGSYRLLAIGASTGGPVALQEVLTKLPANFPLPVILIQHMPGTFTPAFAQRLNQLCQIGVREAQDGDELQPGVALLAPGGRQMMVEQRGGGRGRVRILDGDPTLNYKPSVDVAFGSAAKVYGGDVLAVVLTGMGADGREGARLLKQHAGCQVWAQDEASCVVYGMPAAIVDAGLADAVLPLPEMGQQILQHLR